MAHRKGKATHGSLGGNARQMGEHKAGGRTSNKPSRSENRRVSGNTDASSGEKRPTTGGGNKY